MIIDGFQRECIEQAQLNRIDMVKDAVTGTATAKSYNVPAMHECRCRNRIRKEEPMSDLISRQAANTNMKKYRKKPIVIEAYKTDVALDIETLEGIIHASVGDYIITGVNGEQYPCKPDIFKKTYEEISSAQPERTCVNCGRTANNGGWYADGGTRCPIEEHYALPKDGYCHLWEKRSVTDDDYPERREK